MHAKQAFSGEVWQWHYDFATHHREDGVPAPLALNLHVFLDDVTDDNGPLTFVRGSHRVGMHPTFLDTTTTSYDLWCVEDETVEPLVDAGGTITATGPAGTALVFGDSILHSSPPNVSDSDRRIFSVILNPISNHYTKTDRPDWKHHRSLDVVEPVSDDSLLV